MRVGTVTAKISSSVRSTERVQDKEVQRRLRTLLELAIQIGRREGLLGREIAKEKPNDSKDTP
jgi:hypothetical protein